MSPMLEFHPVTERHVAPARLAELLREARTILLRDGMASIDEYGDMLQWALPRTEGPWRKLHVFHPDWCSFDDRFWGTIHYHAGWIRGTILAGEMEHYTYRAQKDAEGDRFYQGEAYRLTKHTHLHRAGTEYELPGMVPHWVKPTELTITYFEEQETEVLGDLVNPASEELDDHRWTQEQANALMPEVLRLIEARLASLELVV